MKKQVLASFLLTISLIGLSPNTAQAITCPASMLGSGISSDPCQITNATQLQAIQNGLNDHYKLMNDIDLTSVSWSGIGGSSYTNPFEGSLDGNGKKISNAVMTASNSYQGFFDYIGSSGEVKNVYFENFQMTIPSNVGYVGLIAGIMAGTLLNNKITGQLVINAGASGYFGAVAGRAVGSFTALDVDVDATMNSTNAIVGVFGTIYENQQTVTASLFRGTVSNYGSAFLRPFTDNNGLCNHNSFSYYDSNVLGATATSCTEKAKTTAELQTPTSATGIYSNWTSYWGFGSGNSYPYLLTFAPSAPAQNPSTPTVQPVTYTAPAAVSALQFIRVGSTSTKVKWTGNATDTAPISGYAYRFTSNAGKSWSTWTATSSSEALIKKWPRGKSWQVQVKAQNSYGESDLTVATFKPGAVASKPRIPNVKATKLDASSSQISWTISQSEKLPILSSAYRYSLNNGRNWSAWTTTTEKSFTLTGLAINKRYRVQVKLVNDVGTGSTRTFNFVQK